MVTTKRQGFTLLEVLMAMLLLSFIVIMVSSTLTSAYALSAKIHKLPNAYYGAQNEIEKEMDNISQWVKEKYRLQNEINNAATGALDPTLQPRLDDVNAKLAAYKTQTTTLFGKQVQIYKVTVEYTSSDGQSLTVHSGVVNTQTLDRLVPIIDRVKISCPAHGSMDIYFAEGSEVYSDVVYNEKNKSYKFKDLYQWYIGTSGYHTAEYTDIDNLHLENEPRAGTLYPKYPEHYTPILGETRGSITVKPEYYGQVLVCVATPLSKNGAMGQSVVSNPIYISALPKLTQGTYRMIIDVSATGYSYTDQETMYVSSITSRNGLSTKLSVSGSSYRPVVNMDGTPTDTHLSSTGGLYTRFLSFRSSTYLQSSTSIPASRAFVVARNRATPPADFITVGGASMGFLTNKRMSNGIISDTGWQVLELELGSGYITMGRNNVDVAEFIVVTNISDQEADKIWNYLLQKYYIEE